MTMLRVLVISCMFLLSVGCDFLRKGDRTTFDPMLTDVTIFSEASNEIAHAVVYKEHADELVFMSVAHYFDDVKGPYRISLDNLPILRVWRPEADRDVVYFAVSRRGLMRGKHYAVPDFTLDETNTVNGRVIINRDQMYGIRPRRVIGRKDDYKRAWLVDGVVVKGRSGTPVFIEGTNRCMGVVRGYLDKEQQTVVVTP